MCGIFGFAVDPKTNLSFQALQATFDLQLKLSDSRGKEAAGWAVHNGDEITVYKLPMSGRELAKSSEHKQFFQRAVLGGNNNGVAAKVESPLAVLGHSRLVTNGTQSRNENNHPVVRDGIVGVHNGIIVNDRKLWDSLAGAEPTGEVDTEVMLHLVHTFYQHTGSIISAVQQAYQKIEGAASIALLFEDSLKMVLATNTGSLYLCSGDKGKMLLFASERFIAEQLLAHKTVKSLLNGYKVDQVMAGQGYLIDFERLELEEFPLCPKAFSPVSAVSTAPSQSNPAKIEIFSNQRDINVVVDDLQRCSKCILPETFPFIEFDEQGVCNLCNNYQSMQFCDLDALAKRVAPYRSNNGKPDCIVAFSGGRDSSYGLYYMKRILKLNPIAFTYDWGVATDLGRRNQSRVCSKLGIEQIMISADIHQKRLNIRKNIEAWLKKPELGMLIPLIMAGDKQFFYYANKLMKQMRIDLMAFSVNPLEKTNFKVGLCGVDEGKSGIYSFNLGLGQKIGITWYYLRQFLRNPAYFNSSLADTAWSYMSSFIIPHDYLLLYEYLRWDEKEIDNTLRDEFNWETASDSDSTWRIGDATTSFYNYIYYSVVGFTENDTLRSNQIREGMIGRDEALRLVRRENQPRWDSMREYGNMIGFDLDNALAVIEAMPRSYRNCLPDA